MSKLGTFLIGCVGGVFIFALPILPFLWLSSSLGETNSAYIAMLTVILLGGLAALTVRWGVMKGEVNFDRK